MRISVSSVHFDADQKLVSYVENKVKRLTKFFDNITEAEVFLRLQHTGGKIQEKITEIRVHLPGTTLFDRSSSTSFEHAMNTSVHSLERQIKRFKEKRRGR